MAVYDGFFDAVLDEESGAYDRAYDSGSFTEYFGQMVGSGVCVYQNPDSMKVRFRDGAAVVAPGYLFIHGYWLKNDGDYSVPLPDAGLYAITACLDLGRRRIEIAAQSKADPEVYPDSLVLAYVTVNYAGEGAVEDTRNNTNICGMIDAMGSLSDKVADAIYYIDHEIEGKLAQAEGEIKAQAVLLDNKIAEVSAMVDKLAPPPIGSIKFSASQKVGAEWLLCDGSFINETQYPELVAALGKLTPSGDKFRLISDGEIAPGLSNGAIYGGRMWVYSYTAKTLYGVDLDGVRPVKTVALTSEDARFSSFVAPTVAKPLVLSVVPHKNKAGAKLFLSQIILDGGNVNTLLDYAWMKHFLLYSTEFTGDEASLSMKVPFPSLKKEADKSHSSYEYYHNFHSSTCIPQVVSHMVNGVETYYCIAGEHRSTYGGFSSGGADAIVWTDDTTVAEHSLSIGYNINDRAPSVKQRVSFSEKHKGEAVYVRIDERSGEFYNYYVTSKPSGMFDYSGKSFSVKTLSGRQSYGPLNLAGESRALTSFDLTLFPWVSLSAESFEVVNPKLPLPTAARLFVDAGAYLWGKNMYFVFVGTGIIFSRNLDSGSFGYLDTTSVLGVITQFGYLDYSEDEGTLYLLGQDAANRVKVAKIVLNTLYDYANDGAWLPLIASDGVPAYIKAKEPAEGA